MDASPAEVAVQLGDGTGEVRRSIARTVATWPLPPPGRHAFVRDGVRVRRAAAALLALATATPLASQGLKTPVAAGYQPQDKDERGLWMQVDEAERQLKVSNFLLRDPGLNAYVRGVFCRTVGAEACAGVRIYLLRTADFNAAMMPNGTMMVYSGLLLRVRDEAQLAAVLGHEFTHYQYRHSLRNFRDAKTKANAMAWLSMIPVAGYAAAAAMTAVQVGMIGSLYSFSREMEREADAGSIPLMAKAGYDPAEAPRVWEQLRAEQDATAAARGAKSRKDHTGGLFASHPPTAERVANLRTLAAAQPVGARVTGRDQYRAALRPWWPQLVDDQVKLNDFGATEYLLGVLAEDGWTGELLYARGELYRQRGRPDDLAKAADFYAQAVALPDAPVEAWRGLGLSALRAGREDEGRAALKTYLAKRPEAGDRAMIAMLAGEG